MDIREPVMTGIAAFATIAFGFVLGFTLGLVVRSTRALSRGGLVRPVDLSRGQG